MYIGIEIGGTKLQLVRGEGTGKILDRRSAEVDKKAGGAGIREQIQKLLPQLAQGHEIRGVGVGFGGPVDWKTGQIACSHQIEGWYDFNISQWLQGFSQLPVWVDNDANVAGLGEAICGAGKGADPVFYVTLGSGVGGGLCVNGQIFHGAPPGEAEIGHIRLDRKGTIVESRCSGWAVDGRIREAITQHPESILARLCQGHEKGEARFLKEALDNHDPLAQKILLETSEDLAFGLSHVAHLCHPQVIILGGGLSLVGEPLRQSVEDALPRFLLQAFRPGPKIALASLGQDVVPVGALVLAGQRDKR